MAHQRLLSAHALEHAAQLVLDAHIRRLASLIMSKNQPVKVHLRDLEEFKHMFQKGNISALKKGHQDYWSDEKRQDPRLRSEKGGGCKVGAMTGDTLADHRLQSEKGGGSKVGDMTGDTLADHRLQSEKGGGSKVGGMTGDTHPVRPQAPMRSYFPDCKGQTRVAVDGCQRL